jgi:hypothetical protein
VTSPAVEFLFVSQRFFLDFTNVRLVIDRDHDNPAFGDGVALTIFFGVVPDLRAARDEHVPVDDGATNA